MTRPRTTIIKFNSFPGGREEQLERAKPVHRLNPINLSTAFHGCRRRELVSPAGTKVDSKMSGEWINMWLPRSPESSIQLGWWDDPRSAAVFPASPSPTPPTFPHPNVNFPVYEGAFIRIADWLRHHKESQQTQQHFRSGQTGDSSHFCAPGKGKEHRNSHMRWGAKGGPTSTPWHLFRELWGDKSATRRRPRSFSTFVQWTLLLGPQ